MGQVQFTRLKHMAVAGLSVTRYRLLHPPKLMRLQTLAAFVK